MPKGGALDGDMDKSLADKLLRKNTRALRRSVFISIAIVVPVGFASKLYGGAGAAWLNDYASGALYEIFWCLVGCFLLPRVPSSGIALGVFIATSFLEFLQLWHPPFLEAVRSAFIGRTLIGTSFAWWDFPYYVIGCLLGWGWIEMMKRGMRRER